MRRREPVRRPLNVPREYLSRRGLAAFHRLGPGERAARLEGLLVPSYPSGPAWDEPLARAAAEGRFRVEASVNGSEQVICATGFLSRVRARPAAGAPRGRARTRDGRGLDRARSRRVGARPDRRLADARARGRTGTMGVPRRGHARRCALCRPRVPAEDQGMSYTLRGRVESRLAAFVPLVAVACVLALVLHRWWPIEAAALMIGVGICLDAQLYHRLLPYQPGWAAVPIGLARARRARRADAPPRDRGSLLGGGRAPRRRLAPRTGTRPRGLPARAARVRGSRRRARPARPRLGRRRRDRARGRCRHRLRARAARSSI